MNDELQGNDGISTREPGGLTMQSKSVKEMRIVIKDKHGNIKHQEVINGNSD